MEIFNPSNLNGPLYRSAINQSGKGAEIDRYIYSNQSGEGIGSFFGNLFRTAIPIIGQAIKGASKIAKPHLKNAAKEILATGAKRAIDKISRSSVHKKHAKNKRKKWRSL